MAGEGAPTWEEVARSHGRFLYTVAYRLTGNREDAQDLVQEVLLRVRRGLETYQPGSMEGWLSRIATNAFLDEVRRRKRRPVDLLPEDPDWVLPPSGSAEEALASEMLPDDIQGCALIGGYFGAVVELHRFSDAGSGFKTTQLPKLLKSTEITFAIFA